jgi:hypothetical protein
MEGERLALHVTRVSKWGCSERRSTKQGPLAKEEVVRDAVD